MTILIAEIGHNHLGNMTLAKKLIRLARENGADLVKFSLYDSKEYPEFKDTKLSKEQAKMLFDYGNEVGIEVFFSVFDIERVKWCEEIGVKRYKIACSQRNNARLAKAIPSSSDLIISGDGFEPMVFVRARYLYCVPKYPAMISDVDFDLMKGWDGFSDHTIGLDAAKIALARGAEIIEKHFAIDHKTGIDAEWSMTPSELKELKRFENVCQEVL